MSDSVSVRVSTTHTYTNKEDRKSLRSEFTAIPIIPCNKSTGVDDVGCFHNQGVYTINQRTLLFHILEH